MPITCTRRPNSIWSCCECPDCKARNARVRKEREVGLWHTIPREVVWAALDEVLEVLTPTEVNKALGMTSDVIRSALRERERTGYLRRFTHHAAATIVRMARDLDHLQPSHVPAVGTARRLQALATQGWSLQAIADHLGSPGVSPNSLSNIRFCEVQTVTYALAQRVAKVYDDLWDKPRGGRAGTQVKTLATQYGWVVPMAWDDDEIDDPDAQPWSESADWPPCRVCGGTGWRDGHRCYSCRGLGTRNYASSSARTTHVDDIEWLAKTGGTFDSIAERLRVAPTSINTRLARAGRTDLLLLITQNGSTNYNSERATNYYQQHGGTA